MSLKAKFRKSFLDKNSIHEINNKEKFVYFPLHQDEEHETLIGAPFHTNQLEVIKYLLYKVNFQVVFKKVKNLLTIRKGGVKWLLSISNK